MGKKLASVLSRSPCAFLGSFYDAFGIINVFMVRTKFAEGTEILSWSI